MAALVAVLDQLSKWVILTKVMDPPRVIEVLPFFNLVLAWNPGVSFGMFSSNSDLVPWMLSAFALAVCGVLLVYLRRAGRGLLVVAIGGVVGGAIGNVIDRVRFGAVADFSSEMPMAAASPTPGSCETMSSRASDDFRSPRESPTAPSWSGSA